MIRTRRLGSALVLPVALLALASCSSDDTTETGSTESTAASDSSTADTGASASETGITIEGAWARTSPATAENGAAYFTVTSAEDDNLIGASVPDTVAAKVELHETTTAGEAEQGGEMMMDDEGAEGSTSTMGGMGEMSMVPVAEIELPAGEAVVLEPGGLHVMLLELAAPLEVGDEIELTLTFESADPVTVDVPVLADAPGSS